MLLKYQENTRKNLAYQVYTEYIREIHRCIYSLKLRAKNVFPGFVAIIFGIQFVHHYSSLPSSWPYRKHFLMILQNWLISFLNRSKYIFFSNCISRIYQVYRCISHLSRFFFTSSKVYTKYIDHSDLKMLLKNGFFRKYWVYTVDILKKYSVYTEYSCGAVRHGSRNIFRSQKC